MFHTVYGPENVPVDAFALWIMIRDVLDPRHEAVKQPMGEAGAVNGGSPPSVQIMFSAIDKIKRRETLLYLRRRGKTCKMLQPGALARPFLLYANL